MSLSTQHAIQRCMKKLCCPSFHSVCNSKFCSNASKRSSQPLKSSRNSEHLIPSFFTSSAKSELYRFPKANNFATLETAKNNRAKNFSTFSTSKDGDNNCIMLDGEDKPSEKFLKIQSKFCRVCGSSMKIIKPSGDKEWRHVCSSCGFVDYFNPKMVVGCIVEHEGKILLCRRAIEPSYGLWTVPAGYMELNESTAEGAARETFEESTALVQNVAPYAHWDIPAIGQAYILFRARLAAPFTHAPGVESLETRLFDPADIPFHLLAFNTVSASLKLYLEDMRTRRFRIHYGVIRKVAPATAGTGSGSGKTVGTSGGVDGAGAGWQRDATGRLPGGLAEELFGRYEVHERQSFYVSDN